MNVFSKYLLKSITEKKGRTALLLISIAISTALLVASLGSVKAILSTLSEEMKGSFGDFNIEISASKNSEIPLFSSEILNKEHFKKSFKAITIGGYLSSDNEKEFNLLGTSLSDYKNFTTMKLLKQENLEPFEGKKLIISEKTSKNLKVKLGDELKLNILGKEESYKVAAISADKGLFFMDKEKQFTLITPEENVFNIYGEKNKYTSILAVADSKDLNTWIKAFNDRNKENRVVCSKIYDEEQMEQQMNMVRMQLYFMLAIVLLMTTFIIFSSFKLIITERLSIIGVFLSQGATKGKIMIMLLRESLAYGIIGGIIGDLIGAGLTKFVSFYGNPLKEYGIKAVTEYFPPYFIVGFIFALVLSLLSTMIPILSIRKLPVKDVILNTISTSNRISFKGFFLGIVLIGCSVILHITGAQINYLLSIPSLFLAFIGVILIIPKIVDVVFHPLVRFLRNINGLAMLSFNNVKTSKVLINNMRLISVSIISIVMITSLSVSITDVVRGAYEGMSFDVFVNANSQYMKNINDLINDYKDSTNIKTSGTILANLNGDTNKSFYLDYVDPEKYKTFENYTVFNNKNSELDALKENDDGIIISKQMSIRYKIKVGDVITLATDSKNDKFKVLSIFNAKMMDSGNYNLISLNAALKHFEIKYPTQYYISTKVSATDAKKALEKKLKGLGVSIITKEEMRINNEKNNNQMTTILGVFAYITMVIGAFGILGNVSISFIQRKRDLAVLSSVGMTKSGRGFMILLESVFQALIGVLISLLASFGIIQYFTDVFKFLTLDLQLTYPYKSIIVITAATLVLMFITSLSSILKNRKLQIVQELKYE